MMYMITRIGLCLLSLFCVVLPLPAIAAEIGVIGRIVGAPTVERDGRTLPLSNSVSIEEGDRIITDEQTRLEVQRKDGTVLVIGPQSDLTVMTFSAITEKRNPFGALKLVHGVLRVALAKATHWRHFAVTTQTAIISSQSAVWIVNAEAEVTSVFVVEGRVQVTSTSGRGHVTVPAGLGTDIAAGLAPTIAKRWTHARVESITSNSKFAD